MRGYDSRERIVYGTGAVVAATQLTREVAAILARPHVEFVHVRSASNGCFQCRIDSEPAQ